MNPRQKALLWEQWRVAGILTLWCLGLCLALSFVLLLLYHSYFSHPDYRWCMTYWLNGWLTGLTLLFLLRQNVAGHMTTRLEPRLARLPASSAMLTFIPLSTRATCLALYFVCLSAISLVFTGAPLSWSALPVFLAAYLVLQAAAWAETIMLGALVFAPSFCFLLFLLLRMLGILRRGNFIEKWAASLSATSLVQACIALMVFALAAAWVGVVWERRNEHRRFVSLDRVFALLERLRRPLTREFRSLAEGRCWYERRIAGGAVARMLPMMALVALPGSVAVVFALPLLLGDETKHAAGVRLDLMLIRLGPYGAVAFSMLLLGTIREFTRTMWPLSLSEFSASKPIGGTHLAWPHMLAMTRWMMVLLLLAFAGSNALYWGFMRSHFLLMAEQLLDGETRLLALAYFVGPLFGGAIVAWLALWGARPLLVGAAMMAASAVIGHGTWEIILHLFCVYVLIRSGALLAYAWRARLFSRAGWAMLLAMHPLLAVLIYWPGPPDRAAAVGALTLALAASSLILSPMIALPRQAARKRILA